jgi:hypothetical protein
MSRTLSVALFGAIVVTAIFLTSRDSVTNPVEAGLPAANAKISVRIVDASTGKPTTAMVCIRNLDDDTVRLPPDGRVSRRVSDTREFYTGISRDPIAPGQIGPVRKTMGKGDNNDRSYVYEMRPSIPWWKEPVMFQTPAEFSIDLAPGRYRIAVSRGMEFVPVFEEFRVEDARDDSRTIKLERWIDLPAAGWYSGDVHVHHPTLEDAHREFLLKYAEAEDLHVVNVLEMGHHGGTEFKQKQFGKKSRTRRGDYCIVSGQEEPRSTFGHIIGLNLQALARDLPTYDFYDLAFKRIHAQEGALVGYAHFSWNGCDLPRGFPWYVITGDIDFVELMQFNRVNREGYYDYLDLGFRLAAAAGSDVPWGSTIGECRTYVHTGKKLDLDEWFEGLGEGRTFVSNGPVLELTVNGALPGARIRSEKATQVTVKARVRCHAKIGVLKRLEVVSNSEIVAAADGDGEKSRLDVELSLAVDSSRWITAYAVCENGAIAHSSPVYVEVNDQPTWNPARGARVIAKQLEAMRQIDREFAGKTDQRSRGVLARLAKAREFYHRLGEKMKAKTR